MKVILNNTKSICPICHSVLDACYVEDDYKVYLEKRCEEHGMFRTLVAESVEDYLAWISHPMLNVPPKVNLTKGSGKKDDSQCPLHCGTCENHLMTACCVLIDITGRCNQHCHYCFAFAENDTSSDLPLDVIKQKYDFLRETGEERPFNIQLSGGEPTVRDDLPEIISAGKERGFEYIQINTNGKRFAYDPEYVDKVKDAGASVAYLQFDGMNDEIYRRLRNEDLLEVKLKAIENCRKAGLPVVLVPTVVKNVNLSGIGAMVKFLLDNVDIVKGIHFQPVSFFGRCPDKRKDGYEDFANRVTMFDVMHAICDQTDGAFKYSDLCPISTGHSMCCFYGTFRKTGSGGVRSLLSESTKRKGVSCCDTSDPLDIVRRDRDFVLNKWETGSGLNLGKPQKQCCCSEENKIKNLDDFLIETRANMFTVSGMAFMDETSLDAERLKRCRVQQLTEDNKLIPFCAYNSIYR